MTRLLLHSILLITAALPITACNGGMESEHLTPTKPIFDNTKTMTIQAPAASPSSDYDLNSGVFINIPDDAQYVVVAFFSAPDFFNQASRSIDWSTCVAGTRTGLSGYANTQEVSLSHIRNYSTAAGDFTGSPFTFVSGTTYYWAAWAIRDGAVLWSTPPWVTTQL